ncbi:MAG: peptidylprolyl isomerase [Gemmataceae bacterium]
MIRRIWAGGLTALFCASLVLGQSTARSANKVVALVNGVKIHQTELEAVLKMAGPVPVHLPEAQRRQRQMEALGMMIENILMRQFLEKNTKPVSPEEVERRITEMRGGLKEQGKSLDEFCQETNQTMEQLRTSISEHLRWGTFARANITDQQVEAYYKENKDFFDGVTVRCSHIVMRLPGNATEADRQKARSTLEAIRTRLATDPKSDFAEMAKQYSQDPMASKGGDLGFIPRKWFDEAFSRAAFALPVGQVSGVVETDFGLHLIKVTDRKPGRPSEFPKIKEAVREFCSEEMRQAIMQKMRQEMVKEGRLKVELP